MDVAGYRLRDQHEGCAGAVTVHRAEILGRPGRLVRLTWLTGAAAGPGSEALLERWRMVPHPALLPITSSERDVAGLLLTGPMASARPLERIAPHAVGTSATTVARIGAAIAAGLSALHGHGVVHGAVNGHTILLGADDTAVLDGPWHAGCIPNPRRSGDAVALRSAAPPAATEADDVEALAITLLEHLDAAARDGTSSARDRLRSLLEDQRDRPGTAAALEDALGRWQQAAGPRPAGTPGPEPAWTPGATPTHRRSRPAREPKQPLPATARPARPAAVPGPSSPMRRHRGVLAVAAIAGVLGLGITGASMPSDPAASGAAPTPSRQPPAEPVLPPDRPAPPGPAETSSRPVCPGTSPPPGPGQLLLADLDGRGCRAPVRLDGSRLALTGADGRLIEVALDLEVGDQVRVGDLDGSGRDEVLVYRPGTGELFRFDGLAGPGEERVATGETTRWRGGTAVIVATTNGSDRLEVRDGTPA